MSKFILLHLNIIQLQNGEYYFELQDEDQTGGLHGLNITFLQSVYLFKVRFSRIFKSHRRSGYTKTDTYL